MLIRMLSRVRDVLLISMATILLNACQGKYDNVSDTELSKRARELPLAQRYEFYLDVYKDRYPPRSEVAYDIAVLGDPAWRYTIKRATGAGYAELDSALPVLQAFNKRCTPEEYGLLLRTAKKSAPDQSLLRSAVGGIRIACGVVSGTTLKDYEEAYRLP